MTMGVGGCHRYPLIGTNLEKLRSRGVGALHMHNFITMSLTEAQCWSVDFTYSFFLLGIVDVIIGLTVLRYFQEKS